MATQIKAKKAATNPEFRTEGRALSKGRQRMVANNGNANLRPAPLDDTHAPTKIGPGGLRIPSPDAKPNDVESLVVADGGGDDDAEPKD